MRSKTNLHETKQNNKKNVSVPGAKCGSIGLKMVTQ